MIMGIFTLQRFSLIWQRRGGFCGGGPMSRGGLAMLRRGGLACR